MRFTIFLTGVLRNKALCALDKSRRNMAIEERMQLAINVNGKSIHEQSYRDWRENLFEVALQQLLADESIQDAHEYWVVGPGVLDASVASVGTNTTIRLKNCVFLNRSSVPLRQSGIHYVFQGGAYLNFTNLDRPHDFAPCQLEGFDGAFDEVRFKGPETIIGLNNLRENENWEQLKRDMSAKDYEDDGFSCGKNFLNFPREIVPPKSEYMVESMKTTDTKAERKDEEFDFHLDPNRIRTNAEIQLFADVFEISEEEARKILKEAGRKVEEKRVKNECGVMS